MRALGFWRKESRENTRNLLCPGLQCPPSCDQDKTEIWSHRLPVLNSLMVSFYRRTLRTLALVTPAPSFLSRYLRIPMASGYTGQVPVLPGCSC